MHKLSSFISFASFSKINKFTKLKNLRIKTRVIKESLLTAWAIGIFAVSSSMYASADTSLPTKLAPDNLSSLSKFSYSPYKLDCSQQSEVATVDWTVAETLLALGINPLAVGDKLSYQRWISQPKLCSNTIDLGVRMTPNLELLAQLPVKQFINGTIYGAISGKLRAYGPVSEVNFYPHFGEFKPGDSWNAFVQATESIGISLQKADLARSYIIWAEDQLSTRAQRLAAYASEPIAVIQFQDSRHFRLYTINGLVGATLTKLGLTNASAELGNDWGFNLKSIQQLNELPKNSKLIVIQPYPADVPQAVQSNLLWKQFNFSREAVVIPPVWLSGGIPSVLYLSWQLEQVLTTNRRGGW